MITCIDLTGFRPFWDKFREKFSDFPLKEIYYEVLIDFTDFVYDDGKSEEENLHEAKQYLTKHRDDYE